MESDSGVSLSIALSVSRSKIPLHCLSERLATFHKYVKIRMLLENSRTNFLLLTKYPHCLTIRLVKSLYLFTTQEIRLIDITH